jgi:oxygen-dependent protoporphyrinogen oxidase
VPGKPPELFSTDLLSWRGKLRLALEPFMGRPAREETVAEFGRRRLGGEAVEALLAPFLLGIYAGDAEKTSFPAAFPRLAELERQHGSLLRGMLRSRRGQRGRLEQWAPRAGADALPGAIAKTLGPTRLRLSTPVEQIEAGGRIVRVKGGEKLEPTKLALAVPPSAAARLLAPLDAGLAELIRGIEVVPALVVHAGFGADEIGHPLDGFGFLVAGGERVRLLGCVFDSTIWPDRAPAGYVLVRMIYGGARDPKILSLTDDELRAVVAADLKATLGTTHAPRMFHAVRHSEGIPQVALGHVARVAEIEARAAKLGVTLAGNWLHGVAVNDCVKDARRVADRLCGAR